MRRYSINLDVGETEKGECKKIVYLWLMSDTWFIISFVFSVKPKEIIYI